MLHYLENLFHALDLGSLGDAAVRMVQAQTVPEPPAAYRLVRPSDDVCRGLWLGKTRAGGPQVF